MTLPLIGAIRPQGTWHCSEEGGWSGCQPHPRKEHWAHRKRQVWAIPQETLDKCGKFGVAKACNSRNLECIFQRTYQFAPFYNFKKKKSHLENPSFIQYYPKGIPFSSVAFLLFPKCINSTVILMNLWNCMYLVYTLEGGWTDSVWCLSWPGSWGVGRLSLHRSPRRGHSEGQLVTGEMSDHEGN